MTTLVLGIDSGLDGAFAWFYGGRIIGTIRTKKLLDSERRLDFGAIREWCQLVEAKCPGASVVAFMEEPFAPPGRSVGVMQSWRRFGQLEALLWTLGYHVETVQASRWKPAMHFTNDDVRAFAVESCKAAYPDVKIDPKKASAIAYVREHHPEVNIIPPRARNPHDGLADAVCIAVWGSRQVKP
jgi:hypothetical protein